MSHRPATWAGSLHRFFALPALGTFGNLGKGVLRAPGLQVWDAGLFKNFRINERLHFEFRAEFFNLLNRVNYTGPSGANASGPTGTIASFTSGTAHKGGTQKFSSAPFEMHYDPVNRVMYSASWSDGLLALKVGVSR